MVVARPCRNLAAGRGVNFGLERRRQAHCGACPSHGKSIYLCPADIMALKPAISLICPPPDFEPTAWSEVRLYYWSRVTMPVGDPRGSRPARLGRRAVC
jgi:hypothetical protein